MQLFKIQIHSMALTRDLYTGLTEQEAIEIGDSLNWEFCDENCFVWNMDYVEDDETDEHIPLF